MTTMVRFPGYFPTLQRAATKRAEATSQWILFALLVIASTALIIFTGICVVVIAQTAHTINLEMPARHP
jgi:hypothetical protein